MTAHEDMNRASQAPRPIVLVAYNPAWPNNFHAEADAIRVALPEVVEDIHHIGSTAIPGIVAKPVIDILLVVTELEQLDACASALVDLGYQSMGEFGIPGRRYFRRDTADGVRTHHVHAFPVASPQIQRHLAFRDFLRAHPEEARRYGALKLDLAKRFSPDMARYTDGKTAFIRDIEERAAPSQASSSHPLARR
jgi:GrpB-like predicted nucleotidyltransferase (UPF0157 family)